MPVKQISTPLGHSLPPEAPHNITFHIPGWETARALRRREPELMDQLESIYPRFGPWREVKDLSAVLHAWLKLPDDYEEMLFVHPDVFQTAKRYAGSPRRKEEFRVREEELLFKVVDIPLSALDSNGVGLDGETTGETVRIYLISYPSPRYPGALGVWQNTGTGVSSRLAAALLPAAKAGNVNLIWSGDARDEVRYDYANPSSSSVPIPAPHKGQQILGLALTESHTSLRARIASLAQGKRAQPTPDDVFLYPTGMGAVWRLHQSLSSVRQGGSVVVLGSVFHSSYHLFGDEASGGGMKHIGAVDSEGSGLEELEAYLEGERLAGRRVGYIFAEFPSNPILVSLDLERVRGIADRYDVPVVIDDTIGSFCNVDVLGLADVVVTSVTKSVSGYANVMGGAVTLASCSKYYSAIKETLSARFLNEYFAADAAKLLSNSQDYFPRSAILNRNALTLATYLHSKITPTSPLKAIHYPPFTNTASNFRHVMRPSPSSPSVTPTSQNEFTPGYGCLLALEFRTLSQARQFYDHLSVYHGPHLGAHLTLAFPFNDAIWGADPEAARYVASFGARPEQVRVSVGLEDEQELIDTFEEALRWAEGVEVSEANGMNGVRESLT
ncbi:uncharacterized protein CTHT_0057200 [Thermochaetoides thermophila DSM 1495]|uniref:Cystathionine gamma-synthase-like protein n=1 Tax=Chaetomium thermophilum (strain DSM 1495 / CBS 144.50 / IMI 039719) TaxID=759272 RepID=G0SCH0_CHATD|nr:hypothetical protein CTHT_0057200 [Thermochaetoides thermophila DSM 1495]EGS19096.1 hypothetical protein CTHT_0057200 [Thermochaetoides thermophila DSM 1495]